MWSITIILFSKVELQSKEKLKWRRSVWRRLFMIFLVILIPPGMLSRVSHISQVEEWLSENQQQCFFCFFFLKVCIGRVIYLFISPKQSNFCICTIQSAYSSPYCRRWAAKRLILLSLMILAHLIDLLAKGYVHSALVAHRALVRILKHGDQVWRLP